MTSLVSGQRVSKDSLRVSCYGCIDELNAHTAAARLTCTSMGQSSLADTLLWVQRSLFSLGSELATLPEEMSPKQDRICTCDVERLEESIDDFSLLLPPLKNFILPGGCRSSVELHIARTVCRRAERLCVSIGDCSPSLLAFLNRLSDAFFVWSRWSAIMAGSLETIWTPRTAPGEERI